MVYLVLISIFPNVLFVKVYFHFNSKLVDILPFNNVIQIMLRFFLPFKDLRSKIFTESVMVIWNNMPEKKIRQNNCNIYNAFAQVFG